MKTDDLSERLSTAAAAKRAMLERFRNRPAADDPAVIAREEARRAHRRSTRSPHRRARGGTAGRRGAPGRRTGGARGGGRATGRRAGAAGGRRAGREGGARGRARIRAQGRARRALCGAQEEEALMVPAGAARRLDDRDVGATPRCARPAAHAAPTRPNGRASRWRTMPRSPRSRSVYVDDEAGRMRCNGDRCSALTGEVGVATACAVYAVRPDVCRACLPGDHACLTARRRFGLST